MAFTGTQISITSSAVALATHHGNGPMVVSLGFQTTGPTYLGGAAVTSSGFSHTTADTRFQVTLQPGETLYGASTAAIRLSVLEHHDW